MMINSVDVNIRAANVQLFVTDSNGQSTKEIQTNGTETNLNTEMLVALEVVREAEAVYHLRMPIYQQRKLILTKMATRR